MGKSDTGEMSQTVVVFDCYQRQMRCSWTQDHKWIIVDMWILEERGLGMWDVPW